MAVVRIPATLELEFLSKWRMYAKAQQALGNANLLDPINAGAASRKRVKFIEVDLGFMRQLHKEGFPFG